MQKFIVLIIFIGLHLLPLGAQRQETDRYHLVILDNPLNYAGNSKLANAVNGTILMPDLQLILPT